MSKTLLLADGSVTIQRVVELTFAHEDIRVVAIAEGRKAMQWLSNERPDIVLADVDLDGYAIAAHVRKTKRLQHVPVLLLAGAFEPVDQERVRQSGCDGVIIKPFEPQQLVTRVRELLGVPEPVGAGVGVRESSSKAAAAAPPPASAAASAHSSIRAVPPAPPDLKRVSPDMKNDASGKDAPLTLEPLPLAPEKLELPTQPLWHGTGAFGSVGSPPPPAAPLTPTPPPAPPAAAPPPKVSLANAFTALLAAEQSTAPIAPMPQTAPAVVLPESTVEEAVKKVLVKMTDEYVRRVVLETAERLIREEIEKIKANPE